MKKAFTLIELLTVISIIGILATAIIISINPARNQAKDARIRGDVQQLRNLAETYYNSNNFSYSGFSCSSANAATLCNDINSQSGSSPTIVATQTSTCIVARLASGGSICVDTGGKVTSSQSAILSCSGGTCP
jgi:prepilin-type N-terminal cleavage/methylation domain-containing protein